MNFNPGQLEAGLAGVPVNLANGLQHGLQQGIHPGIQHGQGAYPGCNTGPYGQGYLYDIYYYICEESANWWRILLWTLLGLLLAALLIGGIVALALIPVYLNGDDRRVLAGPRGTVNTLSTLQNSVVTTTSAGTLTFWDATTGQLIRTLNPGAITALRQVSPGSVVAIGPQRTLTFLNSNGAANSVSLNQFGDLNDVFVKNADEIYVGTSTGRVLVLNSAGTVVQNLENTGGAAVTKITQLANGDIVTVDANKNIRTWRNNAIVNTFAGSNTAGQISNLETSNGLAPESLLYTIGSSLFVINAADGQLRNVFAAPGTITDIEPLRNGAVALATGKDVFYTNLNTGNSIRKVDSLSNTVTGLDSNANNLFAGLSNGDIVVLDPYTGSNFNAKNLDLSKDQVISQAKESLLSQVLASSEKVVSKTTEQKLANAA